MNRFFKNFIFIIIFLFAAGCSTQKNTGLTRFYHGLTTKYNILFNGSESFKAGKKSYQEAYSDDYSQVLPVFIYGEEDLTSNIKPQMDRTIEKSTKSIRLHSITTKPEQKGELSEKDKAFYNKNEYNIYIDDSYLLMGKAFFYQADYSSAIRIFNFIIKQYKDPKTKYLAYNWLVRANVETKDFREAQNIIDFLLSDMDYPEKLNYELNRTIADFYLKQQKFIQAEPYVSEALKQAKKKKDKLRLTFILAQLKEKSNDYKMASDLYEEVIKMNPSYEMAFNAKIKRATLFTGGKSLKTIRSELLDMLKDDKNIEYQDQIYYALGQLEMKNSNILQAIQYYQLSAATSINNTNQKALTYLALANIFFERSDYKESQAYFDSAVVSLDPEFPGYTELARKNQYLSRLVKNLKIVETQDSLQKVAGMSPNERDRFIQNIIQELREQEAAELERQRNEETRGMNSTGQLVRPSTSTEGGKWYFYNPSAKSFGEPEFKRRWGSRKLEDNWRRKNRQALGVEHIAEAEFTDKVINNKKGLDNKSPEYYMVDLPLTDSAMQASHHKIQTALYNVGEVYRNDLKDYDMAVDAYKDLIDRYPDSEYKVPAYYSLYKVYQEKEDLTQAEVYRNMIIRNYPETKYAKVLVDPNYFKQFDEEEQERKNYYAKTLDLYKQKKYNDVIRRTNLGLNKYTDAAYTPKYRYLRALAMGEVYGVSVLRTELEQIEVEFRNDPVAAAAGDLLASIKANELKSLKDINTAQQQDTLSAEDADTDEVVQRTMQEIEKIYTYAPEAKHLLAIIISDNADINQLKFNIINFNLDFFIEKSYDLESKEFNEFFTLVTVKQFKDASESINYLNKLNSELDRIFEDVNTADYQIFVISAKNLTTLIDEKVVRDYLLFYSKNYRQ